MHLAAPVMLTFRMTPGEKFLIHLKLSKDHSWNLNLRSLCLLLIEATKEFSQLPTRLGQNAGSDSSVDTTRENSIYLSTSCTTVTPENQQTQSSSTGLPKFYDLRPRLPTRDYHEKVIQNRMPPQMRCFPISETAVSSNQLPRDQKRDAIIDSCQRTRTLPSSSETQTKPYVHNTFTTFRHSAQSTPPGYSEGQKKQRNATLRKTSRNAYQNIMM